MVSMKKKTKRYYINSRADFQNSFLLGTVTVGMSGLQAHLDNASTNNTPHPSTWYADH